jgi:hypothetical protein
MVSHLERASLSLSPCTLNPGTRMSDPIGVSSSAQDRSLENGARPVPRPVIRKALVEGTAVQTAMGRSGESMQVLNEAVAEAAERGFGRLALEGRLNLGQAEIAAGSRESGRDRLLTLATEARAAGFLRIARRALDSAEG